MGQDIFELDLDSRRHPLTLAVDTLEIVCHEAVQEMRVGPSESACRSRLQNTSSCCGQKPW